MLKNIFSFYLHFSIGQSKSRINSCVKFTTNKKCYQHNIFILILHITIFCAMSTFQFIQWLLSIVQVWFNCWYKLLIILSLDEFIVFYLIVPGPSIEVFFFDENIFYLIGSIFFFVNCLSIKQKQKQKKTFVFFSNFSFS